MFEKTISKKTVYQEYSDIDVQKLNFLMEKNHHEMLLFMVLQLLLLLVMKMVNFYSLINFENHRKRYV